MSFFDAIGQYRIRSHNVSMNLYFTAFTTKETFASIE